MKTLNSAKGNIKKLLNVTDYKSIKAIQKENPDLSRKVIEEWLLDNYNSVIELVNENIMEIKKEQKREYAKKKKEDKKVRTFTIDLKLEIKYKKNDKVYITDKVTEPYTEQINKISSIVNNFNDDDGYKTTRVIESKINYLDTEKLSKNRKPKIKQMMKRSFVLKQDWLRKAKDIAEYAYDETNDVCVYYQLSNFLLNPPTGRPTKFIDSERTSEESIYNFLSSKIKNCDAYSDEYKDFQMNSGVSTELVALLCKSVKRSMYAYDEDDKCFYYQLSNDENCNYCPIVFYKLHGHMYLLDTKDAIRSVAEENKPTAKKISTTTIDEKEDKLDLSSLTVHHINSFDTLNAMKLDCGIYMLQKSNITEETLKFISCHKRVPKTKNRDNVIIQFSYFNDDDAIVYLACDANYSQNIEYDTIKAIASVNEIKYVNQGIGSVILEIIEKSKKQERQTLTEDEKLKLIKVYKKCCAICSIKTDEFEIDHIVPLSAGGSNDIDNLQPLCKDCHKQKTKQEKELGIYCITDETASYFNKNVYDNVVKSISFKVWQFVEKVNDTPRKTIKQNVIKYNDALDLWKRPIKVPYQVEETTEVETSTFKIDMRKCRRNLLYFSNFEFPVYSVMDSPCEFNGKIRCGMFYVVTENTFPFRGCGWYYEPLVRYGIENGLIDMNEIKLEFIPSKRLANNHFQNNIDVLLEAFKSDASLQKMCVNAYIGLMGKTKKVVSKSKFTLCPTEASEWWGTNHDDESDKNVFIKNHTLDNGEILYEGIEGQQIISETTTYPIYAQILQMEAMELHRLENIIIQNKGFVLDRNTDAVRYSANTEINISDYFWDNEKTVVKYQQEEPKPLEVEKMSNFCRTNTLDFEKFELNWNIVYDYHGTAEEKAKEIVSSNLSYHIDGRAGTGKSYLTNKIIDELKTQSKRYLAFSPTNKGARIIGGKTIHSVYYKFKHNKYKLIDILKNIEYIIIDEISMMVELFYQLFIMIKKIFPTIKFIISGDFGQLPPVNDTWEGDYKNSPAMFELCNGNRIQLIKCRRSDDKLFKLCKYIDNVNIDDFKQTEMTYLNIAYTHNTRIRINNLCMERYIKEFKTEYFDLDKCKFNPKTQDLKLSVGMPVVAHTTNKKLNILNSEKFVVSHVSNESISVKEHDREITIRLKDFHKFFYIGFCITIHTSQGDTFNEKYTIYDWNFQHFCERAKYVALSRATDINNIQIA